MERTLALIKPDAAGRPGAAAKIMQLIEQAGFTIVAKRQLKVRCCRLMTAAARPLQAQYCDICVAFGI